MVKADIRNAWEVCELIGRYTECDLFGITRLITDPAYDFYINHAGTLCVIFQSLSYGVRLHVYARKHMRGKALIQALKDMEPILPYKEVYVDPQGDKRVSRFVALSGYWEQVDDKYRYILWR